MEQVVHKFRTTIGGFNRRDVLNYIEAADTAHRKQIAELQKRLDESEAAREELEGTLAGLRCERGSVASKEAKVRASLEESTRTLSQVRGELSQAETKLAVAKNELSRLQEQVAQLEPMAKSYEELKDRVATVELDAHKKAQATLDEAQAQADALRGETRQWLSGVLGQYEQLRQALDGMDEQIRAISRLSDSAKEGDQAVEHLKELGELE